MLYSRNSSTLRFLQGCFSRHNTRNTVDLLAHPCISFLSPSQILHCVRCLHFFPFISPLVELGCHVRHIVSIRNNLSGPFVCVVCECSNSNSNRESTLASAIHDISIQSYHDTNQNFMDEILNDKKSKNNLLCGKEIQILFVR